MGLLLTAWLVYRPDVQRPFDFVDFPELFALLRSHDGAADRLGALTRYYWDHGRFNPVAFLAIVSKWSILGSSNPGWQWTRFAAMSAVLILAWSILRRMGAGTFGALAGAALFVVSPPAQRGWLRLTAAEPLAAMFVLGATLLTIAGHHRAREPRVLVLLAILAAAAVLTKEMIVAAIVLPIGAAWLVRGNAPRTASNGSGQVLPPLHTSIAIAAGAILSLGPIVWTYMAAGRDAYASRFGTSAVSPLSLLGSFLSSIVPFIPVGDGDSVTRTIMLMLWLTVVLVGWTWPRPGARRISMLAMALGLPAVGTIAYAPWPDYAIIYALPFLFGGALLLAEACATLDRAPRMARFAGRGMVLVVLAFALVDAINETQRRQALQVVFGLVPERVATAQDADEVLVAMRAENVDVRATLGWRLRGMATARDLRWPDARDTSCEEAARTLRERPRIIVVRLTEWCPPMGTVADSIRRSYRQVDLRAFSLRLDSVRIDVYQGRRS